MELAPGAKHYKENVIVLMRKLILVMVMAWWVPVVALQAQTKDPAYGQLLEKMYRKTVPLITVAEAAALQASNRQVLFLDTREQEEYRVSHIREAVWVGYQDFNLQRVASIPRQTPIIVYCSVGYRSEKIGEKLQQAGFTKVRNLYGSIFEWVNQGYPVYKAPHQPTTRVHAYSRIWGRWLTQGTKVY
jgi:rhodanese-related sulfurtransferase